jgi:hypothetical protein
LDDLGAGLNGEFERFDCLNVMTSLGDGAMTGDAERRVESSDKSKIGRDPTLAEAYKVAALDTLSACNHRNLVRDANLSPSAESRGAIYRGK